jgi:ribosomal protein L16/L10AE
MLSPKRTKYRKFHRGRMRGKATRGNTIAFGDGLQALEPIGLLRVKLKLHVEPLHVIQNVVVNYGLKFFQIKV